MATAADDQDQASTCSICLDRYIKPKLLPCFHSFCADCLEKHVSRTVVQGHFMCPQCRMRIVVPPTGIDGFQTNFYITSFQEKEHSRAFPPPEAPVDEKKSIKVCEFCRSGDVRFNCKSCHKLLCASCNKNHKKPKSRRNHHVVAIIEGASGKAVEESVCPKHKSHDHGGKLVFFCGQCNIAVCRTCKQTAHKGHQTEDLQDRVKKLKKNLRDFSFETQHLSHNMEDLQAEGARMECKCQGHVDEIGEHIEKDREQIVKIINSQANRLDIQLKRKSTAVQDSISEYICCVDAHHEKLHEVKAVIDEALEKGSFQEMQEASKTVKEKLQGIKKDLPGKMECSAEFVYVSGFTKTRLALVSNPLGRLGTEEADAGRGLMPKGTQILANFNVPGNFRLKSISATKRGIMINYDPSSGLVHIVDMNGTLQDTVNAGFDISGFTAEESGDIFGVSTSRESISTLMNNYLCDFSVLFENLPLPPTAIALSTVHFFVIGSTKTTKAGILQVDRETGHTVWIFKDEDGIVFKKPANIAFWSKGQEYTNSMLIVADPKAHRVVFLSRQGKTYHITRIYSGEGLHKEVEKFCPEGVCVDKLGNIFVVDSSSRAVVQLSKRGCLMDDHTIGFDDGFTPKCLTSTSDGKLVVGSTEGKIKVIKRASP